MALLLTNAAGLIKVWTDLAAVRRSRLETSEARNKDSQDLHDKVLKLEFATQQLKDSQQLTSQVVDDLRDQCSTLNTNIVKLDMAVANLTEAIKELKQ
ncbi:MAG: hypothetical protein J6T78_04130 [Bacteroidaceae bacterium]|nr:hypothetical protein [Bacteroidaceae bacterium]